MTAVQSSVLTLDDVATLPLDRVLVSAGLRDHDGGLDGVGALEAKLAAAVADARVAVFGLAAGQRQEAEQAVAALPTQGARLLQLAQGDTLAGLLANLAHSAVPVVFGEQPQEVPWMGPADDWVLAWPGWTQWLRERLSAPRDVGTVTLLVGSAGLGKSVWARQWVEASKGHMAGAALGHDAWVGMPALTSWLLVDDLRLDRDCQGRQAMRALAARARRRMQHSLGAPAADASAHDLCLSAWQSMSRSQAEASVWLVDGLQSLLEDGWRGSIPCPPAGVHLVLLGRPDTRLETLLRHRGDSTPWATTVNLDEQTAWMREGAEQYLAHWVQQAAPDSELQQVLMERRPALLHLSEQRLDRLAALRRQVAKQPMGSQVRYLANADGSILVDASDAPALQGLRPELVQALQAAALAPVAVVDLALVALQLSGARLPLTTVRELAAYMDRDGSSVAQPWRGWLLAQMSDAWKRSLHKAWSHWCCHKRPPGDRHRLWWAWHAMQAGQIESLGTLADPGWWQRTFFQDKALESADRLRAAQATAMAWSRVPAADPGLDRALVRALWAQSIDRWGSALVMGHLDVAACWPGPPHVGVLWMNERLLTTASSDEHRWVLTSSAQGGLYLHRLEAAALSQGTRIATLLPPEGWQVAMHDPAAHAWIDGNLLRVATPLQQTDRPSERALGTWAVSFDGRAGSSTVEPLPQRSTRMQWVGAAGMVGHVLGDAHGVHLWRTMTGTNDEAETIAVPWPPLFDNHAVQLALGAVGKTIVVAAADASGRLWCAAWPVATDGVGWKCLQDTPSRAPLSALVVTDGPHENHAALVGWAQERTVQWAELILQNGALADVLPCKPFCAHTPVTALAASPAPGFGWLLALGDQAGTVHWGHWPAHGGLADAAETPSPLTANAEAASEDHAVRELAIFTASRARSEAGHRLTHWIARRADGDVAWGAWADTQPDPALGGRTWAGDGLMGTIRGIGHDDTQHPMALATRLEQGRHAVCWIATAPQDGPLPVVRQGRAAAALKREATIWSCACNDDGDHAVALVGFGKAPLFVQRTASESGRPWEHALWNRSMPLVSHALADHWGWLVVSINGLEALDLSWEARGKVGRLRLSLMQTGPHAACPALAASVDAESKLHLWLVNSDGSLFTWSCKLDRLCDDLPWHHHLPAGSHPRVSHLKVWRRANAADRRTDWLTVNDAGEIEVGQWQADPDAGRFLCVRRSSLGPGDVQVVDGAVATAYSARGTLDGVAWRSASGRLHATGRSGGITEQVAVEPAEAVQMVHEVLGLVSEVVASQPGRAGEALRLWVLGAQSEAVAQLTLVGNAWRLGRMRLHRTRHGLGSAKLAAAGASACRLIYTQGPGRGLVSIPVTWMAP